MVHALRPCRAVALVAFAASPLAAQRNVPSTYAITNARVIPVSGATIEKGTIVIRDGLIAAVGPTVAIPADARVIDGTGLSVYPGFIDAYGSLGIPVAAGGAAAAATARPAAPNSNYPVGLQPEISVLDLLRAGDDAFAPAHAAGVTTVLTAQGTGVWRGQSAVSTSAAVMSAHGDQGTGRPACRPSHGVVVVAAAAAGGLSGSLMGVFAALRQQLFDAHTIAMGRSHTPGRAPGECAVPIATPRSMHCCRSCRVSCRSSSLPIPSVRSSAPSTLRRNSTCAQ